MKTNEQKNEAKVVFASGLGEKVKAKGNEWRRSGEAVSAEGQPAVKIPLTRGMFAIVDLDVAPAVLALNWSAKTTKRNKTYYALSNNVKMEHFLFGRQVFDHINGNGLDNRRLNLRSSSASQNNINRRMPHNKCGFRGVLRDGRRNSYFARIGVNKKYSNLGYFKSPIDAAKAYDEAAQRLHGPFAVLNFPKEEAA